jgi:FKBP-type peptidyl-prolyl cis-trans isomerase FkpA
MKRSFTAVAVFAVLGLTACGEQTKETTAPEAPMELTTDVQRQSYALGSSMGSFALSRKEQLGQLDMGFDDAALKQGFLDAIADKSILSMEEMQTIIRNSDAEVRAKQEAIATASAEENIAKGQAFLAENANKEGVVVTESGLQYEVLVEGTGTKPAATDTVKVHYKGTLLDGTEFDSSYKRGEPATFPLNRVIKGWTEGVQLMSEGSKYKFFIPSELGYGARATGAITPNSTLIFEVELLDVVEADAAETENN